LEEAKLFNRIYVASIHQDLSENDIRSVFEAFGKITTCKLATDPMRPGKHKGYGYIEYETSQGAHDSVSAMNLFDLGGQYLRVGKAVTPPNAAQVPTMQSTLPTAAAIAAAAVTAQITALEAVNKSIAPPGIAIPQIGVTTFIPTVMPQLDMSLSQSPTLMPLQSTVPVVSSNPLMFSGSVMPVMPPPTLAATLPATLSTAFSTAEPAALTTALPNVGIPFSAVTAMSTAFGAYPGLGFASSLPHVTMGVPAPTGIPPPAPIVPVEITKPVAAPQSISQAAPSLSPMQQLQQQQQAYVPELLEPSQTLQQQEDIQIKGAQARHMVMQKLMRPTESHVMVLKNMVGPEDVDEDLENEVTDECSKYGKVEHVIIYQEKQSEDEDAEIIVKIFVQFSSHEEMKMATAGLNGRFFAGRSIQAVSYDQNLFDANDLSA